MPKIKRNGAKLSTKTKRGKQKRKRSNTGHLQSRASDNREVERNIGGRWPEQIGAITAAVPTINQKKGKDPRVADLKRSNKRKDDRNEKMKQQRDVAVKSTATAKAAAKASSNQVRASNDKVRAIRTEAVSEVKQVRKQAKRDHHAAMVAANADIKLAQKESDMKVRAANEAADVAIGRIRNESARKVSVAWAVAKEAKLEAETALVNTNDAVEELEMANAREAAAKAIAQQKIDEVTIQSREKVAEHKKRAAAVLEKQKLSARDKHKKQKLSARDKHKKQKMEQDAKSQQLKADTAGQLKSMKTEVIGQKKATEEAIKQGGEQVLEERRDFTASMVEEKKRHREERLSDINIMEGLRAEVSAAKAESAELRKAIAKANMREAESAVQRLEFLKTVHQMEMDSALDQQKLEEALDELSKPDFVFEQVKCGNRSKRWSLRIVQLILEELVAGVPPASMAAAITAFVKNIAPNIIIKKLPSVWFVRRCRTVLLIVCQILAAHRLSKATQWGTMHSDGTARRHVDIINLIITVMKNGGE